jgi:mono/diheme cytochrome c family protein
MRIVLVLGLGLAGVTGIACGKNTEPPPPSSGSPQAQTETGPSAKPKQPAPAQATGDGIPEEALNLFGTVCAACHGTDGSGNGPAAASLNPKPRNYTDAAWQASVTDDDLRKIILLGGQGVGKSAMMPGNPNLKDKPEVIDGLVKIVRQFGAK